MTSLDNMRRRFSLVSVVISSPLDEVIFPSEGLSLLLLRFYPFMNLGEERYCENKVTCPRPQDSGTGGLELEPLDPESSTQTSKLLAHHISQPIQFFFHNRQKAVWLVRCNWLFVRGVWECNPDPKPLSKTTFVLTAIVFVISVRAIAFSVAHICCREAVSPLTGKQAGSTFTIVFVWFIFTCKVAITSQIFLDTFAIFALKLLIATPEI